MTEPPAPMTPPKCDCTDLDSFMLNVERLMASELVALASHEAIAAALFLWCRAWKQMPAASLPDDDKVNAAFARLPLPRFRKLKADIMRGFVKCSDGRLYNKTLAAEALRAYERKGAFQRKRETDNERLKKWREKHKGNSSDTHDETRFVAEGRDDTVRDVTVVVPIANAIGRQGAGEGGDLDGKPDWWPKRDRFGRVLGDVTDKLLFDVGKAVLGKSAGGQIAKLKKVSIYARDWRAALELLLRADDASDPPSWFAKALRNAELDEPEMPMHEKFPEREYRA